MNLDSLDIAGYAESLDSTLVPHVVPPIYRLRDDPDKLLFPPFHLAGRQVIGAAVGTQAQMDQFVSEGRATRLDQPIAALADHELWIDQEMQPRYESFDVAKKTLRAIAEDKATQATRLLLQGDHQKAEEAANTALGADDRLIDPFVIKAAIALQRGEKEDAESLKQTAMVNCTASTFDHLLQDLLSELDHNPASTPMCRFSRLGILPPATAELPEKRAA